MLRRFVAWTIGAAVVLGGTTVASAHPQIDRARARFDQADLDGALTALAAAESSDDLSREDVLRLLELRAMVRFTQGEIPAMEQDLTRLASIDPGHTFGDEVPPDVVEAFARARGGGDEGIGLEVSVRREPAGVTLDARLRGDRGGIARQLVLRARVPPDEWEEASATPDEVSLTLGVSDAEVEYYGRVIGPGGAVIFELGSRDEPQLDAGTGGGREPVELGLVPDEGEEEEDDSEGVVWWPYVAAGAGAAVVVTVVAILLAGSGGGESDITRPGFPDVMGF